MPMSSNLSSLLLVSEACKQHSRKGMSRLCQATCSRWFLLPKHVNKTAGRTGCAYVKQLVLLGPCFRTMHTAQPGGQVVPMPSNLSYWSLFPNYVNNTAGRTGRAHFKQTCRRSLFPNHVLKIAGRTGCAYVKQHVLVVLFPKHANNTTGGTCAFYVKQFVHVGFFCCGNMQETQPGGQDVPISSSLSPLVFVYETCEQNSWEDRLCLCRTTCPRWFLFRKHVHNSAGRTGCAYVKQFNLSFLVLVSETCKQHSWEDRLCLCQATCPRWSLFLQHVKNTARRTGCAYVKQLVLFAFSTSAVGFQRWLARRGACPYVFVGLVECLSNVTKAKTSWVRLHFVRCGIDACLGVFLVGL